MHYKILIAFVVITSLSHFQIIGSGGAFWYLWGPERIEVRNSLNVPVSNIKIEDRNGNSQLINSIPAGKSKRVKISGGETDYRISAKNPSSVNSGWVYTEVGNCVIFNINEKNVTSTIGDAFNRCFWL